MKKIVKYSLYGLTYIAIIFFLAIMFIVTAKADLIKPNNEIDPYQVVKIQLKSLMNNDDPKENYGIKQTWEFAHPNNQKYTGPLEKFIIMLKGNSYKMLLNHIDHKITEVQQGNSVVLFEVVVLGKNKSYYKFNWQVEKYEKEGLLKGCWLTTRVSEPMSLGSSI
ncbi:DUF4864 domain-containing protein [Candidatus Pelagibacter sp.]|nr:DUF4864 domain-containing protein [Candidatus Pelagibacter sp.]